MGPPPLGLTLRLPSPTSLRRPLIILTFPFFLFTSVLLFEQGRWLWHRQRRLKELQSRWSESELPFEDITDDDEGLEPANPDETRQAVVIKRGGGGYMKRIFTSLKFAGRFVNPFWEWRDKNATNVWEYLRWQLTRVNRNGVPGVEVCSKRSDREQSERWWLSATREAGCLRRAKRGAWLVLSGNSSASENERANAFANDVSASGASSLRQRRNTANHGS